MTTAYIMVAILLGIFIWQFIVWLDEVGHKNRNYRNAVHYARKHGKPMLVAGGPWGTKKIRRILNKPAHGGGDVCVDLDQRALGNHECGMVADITALPFRDKSFGAVFSSHVMEHLATTEDAARALEEMKRVGENVFIVYPAHQSITAWLKREHHLWLWQKKNVIYLMQRGQQGKGKPVSEVELPLLPS